LSATLCGNFCHLCIGKGHSTLSYRAAYCPACHTHAGQLNAPVWNDLGALLTDPKPLD
jgi:hypothetical protein